MLRFFVIFNLLLVFFEANDKFIFVATTFRHGARAPNLKGKTDQVGENWSNSMELTGIGKRMHYILGLRNRIKYITEGKFLSEKYKPNELEVFSSETTRTVMSLHAHLQGLYPQSERLGDCLTQEQLEMSNPPIDTNYPKIQEEITNLQYDALPNSMTVIPFITVKESQGINMYEMNGCRDYGKGYTGGIIFNNSELIAKEFAEKFGDLVNQFKKRQSYNYTFAKVKTFCDSYVSSYVDKRAMTELRSTGINMDELYEICLRVLDLEYKDRYTASEEVTLLRGSILMRMIVDRAKTKIDEDINGVNPNSSNNTKMMIVSGHDSTLALQELFFIYSLGLSMDSYRYAKFASQTSLEFIRNDEDKADRTYSDYSVNYYFNDEKIFTISAKKFFDEVEPKIWTEEEIDTYCHPSNNNIILNENVTKKKNSHSYFIQNKSTALILLMFLFVI